MLTQTLERPTGKSGLRNSSSKVTFHLTQAVLSSQQSSFRRFLSPPETQVTKSSALHPIWCIPLMVEKARMGKVVPVYRLFPKSEKVRSSGRLVIRYNQRPTKTAYSEKERTALAYQICSATSAKLLQQEEVKALMKKPSPSPSR